MIQKAWQWVWPLCCHDSFLISALRRPYEGELDYLHHPWLFAMTNHSLPLLWQYHNKSGITGTLYYRRKAKDRFHVRMSCFMTLKGVCLQLHMAAWKIIFSIMISYKIVLFLICKSNFSIIFVNVLRDYAVKKVSLGALNFRRSDPHKYNIVLRWICNCIWLWVNLRSPLCGLSSLFKKY